MNADFYREFMLSRILDHNGFGSADALLAAIESANQINPETHWRDRKAAFNAIAMLAPMRNDGPYSVTHSDLPTVIGAEMQEFETFERERRATCV